MKKIAILLISFLTSFALYAQDNDNISELKSYFNSMPDSICPQKTDATIDSVDSKSNSLMVKTSQASTIQIKVLRSSKLSSSEINESGSIICVINTYYAPVAESVVTFYDLNWNRVGTQSFSLNDFSSDEPLNNFSSDESLNGFSSDESLKELFVPVMISAKFGNDNTIQLSLSDANVTDDDKKRITFSLTKSMKWNGSSFE